MTRDDYGRLGLDGPGREAHAAWRGGDSHEHQLDRLADRGSLNLALMQPLADAVVRLHEIAEWCFDSAFEGMTRTVQRHHAALRQPCLGVVDQTAGEEAVERTFQLIHQHADRLESRRTAGSSSDMDTETSI